MSAFLGPIHHWLYHKIQFQEELIQHILSHVRTKSYAIPGIDEMDEKYGVLESGELADMIDGNNIHGWLQERISMVENRLAYLVTMITDRHPERIFDVREAAYVFGKQHAAEEGITLKEAYNFLDQLILNGMPCDRINSIKEEDEQHIVWTQTSNIHAPYWRKMQGNAEYYYEVRQMLAKGILENAGIIYRQIGNQTFEIKKAVSGAVLRKERLEKTKELTSVKGHPLQLFAKENDRLRELLKQAKEALKNGKAGCQTLEPLREISIHYAKKGDLLYPLLKSRYGIAGPSDLLWTTDDEIRDELAVLVKTDEHDPAWQSRFEAVLVKIEEMIFKEENVTFSSCAVNFTDEEWIGIYHDQKDYAQCFGVKPEIWEMAEENRKETKPAILDGEIVMPGGHVTVEQLTAILNTLPFEITFVDADNINRYFNEGPKDFKRPQMAIDRSVFSCHPPKIEEKVRHIINGFRTGEFDEVPVRMEKNGKTLLVRYMAVRDREGKYLGTLELVGSAEL